MFAQETLVKEGAKFADQHGIVAFMLVGLILFIMFAVWKVWKFITPLMQQWVEKNIEATERNSNALERNADALELIGASTVASEKSNELVLAKIEGVNGNVEKIQSDLDHVKDKIETIEQKLNR